MKLSTILEVSDPDKIETEQKGMKTIMTKGNYAVIINDKGNGYVFANMYVNVRDGIAKADITTSNWQGKTIAGAKRWATKMLKMFGGNVTGAKMLGENVTGLSKESIKEIRTNIERIKQTLSLNHWPKGYIENEKRQLAYYQDLLKANT